MAEDEDRSFAAKPASPRPASPNVREPQLGQGDNPQEDWGEEVAPDAVFSSNHTRRPERTEAERGQGAKTRKMNKDIVSRRAT